ncbi:hypothetical protein PUNSTDRAFT_102371 [Punctularia strigosozonata HHB-11173 SS5]|uniref:uncharacterized protein n=1 Tax=Punctularia strigosozonata (strain HHB-11173) TaxID=741275 RepID=UPI00044185CA|nr:uncharacterized protein PUNSTDRAFT_102371 [Punctularia strigosozonata HHB-11173 SS5]EIN08857.1 hypothetical protein PUNSTDRAFT_102371 [Punctularia strigosozonata HHB-11173 SS5]
MQQQPTLRGVWIRSTRDAMHIFHGVALGRCPMVTRRLDAEERRGIVAGNVYVWEERGANSEATGLGMERWTDGMSWGPSRVRDEFLFYHEKDADTTEDTQDPSTRWALRRRQPPSPTSSPSSSRPVATPARSQSTPGSREQLIKQTYSVHVSLPLDRAKGITRKWHLTAYFSQESIDTLNTVDCIPRIGNVPVPEGWFRSARAGNRGRRAEARGMDPVPGPDGFAPIAGPSSHAMPGSSMPTGYAGYNAPVPYAHGVAPGYTHNGYVAIQPYPGAPAVAQYSSGSYAPRYPYREQEMEPPSPQSSPSLSTSSLSSDNNASARLGISGSASPASCRPRSAAPTGAVNLVPLQDLQQSNGPRRDPTDEELVRRFRMIG